MGLFDQVLGVAAGLANQQGDTNNALLGALTKLVNDQGGVAGLVQSFQNGGLGDIVKSWVSTGQNLPISAEQIQSVLGSEQVKRLAGQLGISPEQMSAQLAQYLPQAVDQLTPNGEVPASDELLGQGLDLLKGKLFG